MHPLATCFSRRHTLPAALGRRVSGGAFANGGLASPPAALTWGLHDAISFRFAPAGSSLPQLQPTPRMIVGSIAGLAIVIAAWLRISACPPFSGRERAQSPSCSNLAPTAALGCLALTSALPIRRWLASCPVCFRVRRSQDDGATTHSAQRVMSSAKNTRHPAPRLESCYHTQSAVRRW
jgi:hypothetical protein